MASSDSDSTSERTFGIMSIAFGGLQGLFHLTTMIMPEEAPWAIFIILLVVALVFAIMGIAFAVVGLTRRGGGSRTMSMTGLVANTTILVIAILGWVVFAMGEYS